MDKRGRYAIPIDPTEEVRKKPPMITIRLSIDQYNEVVQFSHTSRTSLNNICLNALQEYISARSQQPRGQYIKPMDSDNLRPSTQ